MKKLLAMVIVVMAAAMLCACGSTQQPQTTTQATEAAADPIIGTWKVVKYSMWISNESDKAEFEGNTLKETFGDSYYKFDADGTGTITSDAITQTKWKNTAPGSYLMTFTNSSTQKESEVAFTLSDDTLTGLEGSRNGVGAEYIMKKE